MYSDNELKQLSEMAYQNACELLEESLILFNASRFPRAYVLAHLASEEIAKIPMIYGTRVRLKGKEKIGWKNFNKKLTGHQSKLRSIAQFDYMNDELDLIRNLDLKRYETQLDFVKKFDLIKNMGLYSGYHENTVFKPSDQFTLETAKSMISLTEGRLKCLKSNWQGMISGEVTDQAYEVHKAYMAARDMFYDEPSS
ncbi:AbiV family abortive infection protein [Vibrio sp. ES.051]|uniref:AbiV family abortive infection protein n=1 Tax=Vibrio sp. ES.051 TaxID=1761909 RepID=UPI000BFA0BA1|nr:AbiV family abortive infection protein [Vibrio sp. ES.051]PFG56353.1 AbiV family abortive infection protein [Vibrio sp. ES.051]